MKTMNSRAPALASPAALLKAIIGQLPGVAAAVGE
jgi:hypothetical protein